MPPRSLPQRSTYQDEIRRLRNELDKARSTVINLMPDDMQAIVQEHLQCESGVELNEWFQRLVVYALDQVEPVPKTSPFREHRVRCPLCRGGPESFYDDGFKFPLGLEKHLEGAGTARQCSVMEVIWNFGLERMREDIARNEQAAKERAQATSQVRRATETLWRVDQGDPKLLDELWIMEQARDPASLASAEDRLTQIGLKPSVEGAIKCYREETEEYVVYADPRVQGRIEFRVYSKTKKRKRFGSGFQSFRLLDGWKNSLAEKYKAGLEAALLKL